MAEHPVDNRKVVGSTPSAPTNISVVMTHASVNMQMASFATRQYMKGHGTLQRVREMILHTQDALREVLTALDET